MPSVAHHQPFASERHPSNSGKSTILIYYFVPLVSRNYWSYTGWSKYSYQYLCFPVSGFLEVTHLEDLSLSLYVYIIIYIDMFPGATNMSLKIHQLMCFTIYYVYTLMTTQGFLGAFQVTKCDLHLSQQPFVCYVGPGHHWAWFHSLEQG